MTTPETLTAGFDTSFAHTLPKWLTFDQFGRYSLIREAINAARGALNIASFKILDVGGYFRTAYDEHALPILYFLPHDSIIVLDQVDCPLPEYKKGDGRKLHFDDEEFDFVVTADTLEHVPAENRTAFIDELTRVARYGVILLAPFKQAVVEDAERVVFDYIKAELNIVQPQLAEHYEYGLPKLAWLESYLTSKHIAHHVYPSGYVYSWLTMMLAKHYIMSRTPDADIHGRIEQFYIRWLAATERRTPSYRYGVVMAVQQPQPWLAAVEAAIRPTICYSPPTHEPDWHQAVNWLLALLNYERPDQALQTKLYHDMMALQQAVLERDATIQALQHQLAAQTAGYTAHLAQRDHACSDLQQRALWYAERASNAEHDLKAVQNGYLMRLLKRVKGLLK